MTTVRYATHKIEASSVFQIKRNGAPTGFRIVGESTEHGEMVWGVLAPFAGSPIWIGPFASAKFRALQDADRHFGDLHPEGEGEEG